jgi:serine phosphatase RsbU (regulator of sigma subunit)
MTFFIAVGDALWEAFVEQLRSDIRQEKRQRLTEQLRIAKRIQQHLLPKTIPQVDGFDFAGRLVPAEEVGGDYWSIKNYPQDQTITMKLADVSGHGIGAATLVAAVKFISGGYYRGASSPQEVMERTNQVLVKETPHDILVTMIYGWLNPVTRVIRLVNAGHSPVFIARQDGFQDIEPTGPVLGVLGTAAYSERQELLQPGDILVFASDGITEAGSDRRFGTDRLKEVVWDHRRLPAREIADAVIDAVMRYDVTVPDDLSIVVTRSLP